MNDPKGKLGCLVVSIIFVIILLIMILAVLFVRNAERISQDGPELSMEYTEESSEETISYVGETIEVKEEVEKNTFTAEDFSVSENGMITYNAGYSANGIDVSSHQGEINWQLVKEAGISFAMIRVGYRGYSEGTLNYDDKFQQNIEGALAAGLDVGVYFYSQAISTEEAMEEARFVMDAIDDYNITYPVVFDWETIEDPSARTNQMGKDEITACALAFCEMVITEDYEPCVYFNSILGYLAYDISLINGYSFWLAEYDTHPEFYYNFHIWQYSSTGTVSGIDGEVDLNLCFKAYSSVKP